jgi:hypothetical protein
MNVPICSIFNSTIPSPADTKRKRTIRSQKKPVQWQVRQGKSFRVVSQVKGRWMNRARACGRKASVMGRIRACSSTVSDNVNATIETGGWADAVIRRKSAIHSSREEEQEGEKKAAEGKRIVLSFAEGTPFSPTSLRANGGSGHPFFTLKFTWTSLTPHGSATADYISNL